MSTDELLRRISEGDNIAFEKLYLETRRGLYAFLYTYLHNHHDVEDAMQDVYLKIKRNIHLYDPTRNGRAWMLEIAKNHALNEIRRQKKQEQREDVDELSSCPPKDSLSVTDLMERILSEEERRIIVLHVLWGYKHREIGEIIGAPTGTVTSKYKRATEKLRLAIKEVSK